MSARHFKTTLLILPFLSAVFLTVGCQPKTESKKDDTPTQSKVEKVSVPVIQSKVVTVKLPKNKLCLEDGCTTYHFQTVETNQPWINEYFMNRIKKADPNAFDNIQDQQVKLPEGMPQDGQSIMFVRYLGQNYNVASFQLYSYTYSAGAAHGMHHEEYVIFDLNKKKRVSVADLLKEGSDTTVRDRLYSFNQSWLEEHNISKDKFQLSDNFYYGNEGIVFVYPLYELASYAEGLSELTLPYDQAIDVVKPKYVPSQPVLPKE
ncbi:RsiV family protein [Acinetobacter ursingii]|uniref:RsiV family protein n=1 Tax=Acinetobacter ursingii TaxID=108980 RepID=UPI00124DE575|nr:RsiV family protein [Acinetobacter ursingii]